MSFNFKKIILNPLYLVSLIYIIQLFIWILFSQGSFTIEGVPARFVTTKSILIFTILFLTLYLGLFFGRVRQIPFISISRFRVNKSEIDIKSLMLIANCCFFIFLIAELVYIYPSIVNFKSIFQTSFQSMGLLEYAYTARENSKLGVTSFNNVFLLSSTIYFLLLFHPNTRDRVNQKQIKKMLWIIFILILFHAIFLASRMFLFYFLLPYILFKVKYDYTKKLKKRLFLGVIVFGFFVFIAELYRFGMYYAYQNGESSIYNLNVIKWTFFYIGSAYLSNDFNNMFTLLSLDPSYTLISTNQILNVLYSTLTHNQLTLFYEVPGWTSAYNTVNIIGLIWYDMGVYSFLYLFLMGVVIQRIYLYSKISINADIYYALAYIGIFSMTRINYFSQTIFFLNIIVFFILTFILFVIRKSKHKI
ncbi:O-antigen polymerase [Priestia megaterium]